MTRVRVVDSHTGGEPTRVVLDPPELGAGTLAERAARFDRDHAAFRRATITEPRGSDVWVGALLLPPDDPTSAAAVVFYNPVGRLGMCGHGTMGVVATLAHQGQIGPGLHAFETPAGTVHATLDADGSVTVANVASRRTQAGVRLDVPGRGTVAGDVAWGGNWFFLADAPTGVPLDAAHADALTAHAWAIRRALQAAGVTGDAGAEIDHVELAAATPTADRRVFVLCPGGAWDRSPCGTGTSATLACLAADGHLAPGEVWRQESPVGSHFEAWYAPGPDGGIRPSIRGRAFVTAEAVLLFDPSDPFVDGLPA